MTFSRLSLRVQFFKIILISLLSGCALLAVAQEPEPQEEPPVRKPGRGSSIIDDSTKQIYGPTTSRFFYEEDVFFNQKRYYFVDTVIRNFHRYDFVQRHNNMYQDLGNIGTAIRPIFNAAPDVIGVTSGFDAYDLYWESERIKYYDTKSPYSNLNIILGGRGRSITRVAYSRNVNPRWNFGFNFRGLFIDKQVQRSGKGDRNVRNNFYNLYTTYQSKDSAYTLFAHFQRTFHQTDEYGGVAVDDDYTFGDFFLVNAQPTLTEAESNDYRNQLHVFHQYKVGGGFQLYHTLDYYRQRNQFNDNPARAPENYYDAVFVDSTLTRDQVEFRTFRNEAGIKGTVFRIFYNGYAALRNFNMDYKYFYEESLDLETSGNELYVGGRIALQLDSLVQVRGHLQWMFDNRYRLDGSIQSKWFAASISRSVSSPTLLQQAYRASHDMWLNTFDEVQANEIKGNLIYRSSRVSVFPGVRFASFTKYIFFKQGDFNTTQTVLPVQSSGFQTLVSPELSFTVVPVKNLTVSAKGIYSRLLENADDALQLPEYFVNAQLAYANIWFNGNFDFQIGADLHWKSEYFAPGYDVAIQQFYVQQNFKSPMFPVVDVFLNAKIKRGRIFLKYNNLLKAFSDFAAIPTPYYPGLRNVIDFGFDWSFYD